MEVLSAMDLKNGKTVKMNRMGSITQPIQFLPRAEKDAEWAAWNADWLEWNGIKQVRRNAYKMLKNYKLAKGIIDKADYIVEPDNELKDLMEVLVQGDVFNLVPAQPHTQAQPPAAQHIQRGGLLGHQDGLALRQDDDAGS